MLIDCPSCATSYDVDPESLGPGGRSVRCVRCRAVWQVPSRADRLLAAAEALAPEAAAAEDAARFGPASDRPPGEPAWGEGYDAATVAEDENIAAGPGEPAHIEAPSIAPVDFDDGRPPIDADAEDVAGDLGEPRIDIETAASQRLRSGGRAKRRPSRWSARWPLSNLQSGILALLLLDSILVGWRADFVRALPQTASFFAMIGLPVNLRGLAFDGVSTRTEQRNGVPILVVEGNIVNTSGGLVDVPHLKFLMRNAARQEIYAWTTVPSRSLLPAGQSVSFHTRLASPPLDGRDVVVRFVNRRDMLAATP